MSNSNRVTRLVNSNNPGQLDKQISFYGPQISRGATGSPAASSYVLIEENVWAGVVEMPERSGEIGDRTQQRAFKSYRIKVRHRTDINEASLVSYGGQWLEINAINTMGMRNEWLILMCQSWSTPEAPTISRKTTAGDTRVTGAGDTRVLE